MNNSCDDYIFHVVVYREEQHDWPADPMWTESNWPSGTPRLVMYLQEGPGVENALLAAGLTVTVVTALATLMLQWAWEKRLKRD